MPFALLYQISPLSLISLKLLCQSKLSHWAWTNLNSHLHSQILLPLEHLHHQSFSTLSSFAPISVHLFIVQGHYSSTGFHHKPCITLAKTEKGSNACCDKSPRPKTTIIHIPSRSLNLFSLQKRRQLGNLIWTVKLITGFVQFHPHIILLISPHD